MIAVVAIVSRASRPNADVGTGVWRTRQGHVPISGVCHGVARTEKRASRVLVGVGLGESGEARASARERVRLHRLAEVEDRRT